MTPRQFLDYARGARGSVTVKSLESGAHYTYRFRRAKDDPQSPLFVSVLGGPEEWHYVGIANLDTLKVHLTKKSAFHEDSVAVKALAWVLRMSSRRSFPENVQVLHDGTCGRCGRALTHPDSIESGIGPICAEKG